MGMYILAYCSSLLGPFSDIIIILFMIVLVFFPDNVPRRDRAPQLQNDISVLQASAREAKDAMDKEDKRMVPYINQILKNNKMSTFDDLRKKLNNTLTDDQKNAYQDVSASSAYYVLNGGSC